jgi:hypothetical protein
MDQEVEAPRFFGSAIGLEKSVGAPSSISSKADQ